MANRVARVIGQGEANERFLSIALFQGNERPNAERAARMAGNESRLPGRYTCMHVACHIACFIHVVS